MDHAAERDGFRSRRQNDIGWSEVQHEMLINRFFSE